MNNNTIIECVDEDELNKCRIKANKAKCIGLFQMGLDPMSDASKLLKYDKNILIEHIALLMKKTDEEIDAELEVAKTSYVPPTEPVVEPVKIHYYNLYNALYDTIPIVEPVIEPIVPVVVEEQTDNIVV